MQRWRLANIIGAALERQTKYRKFFTAKRPQSMVNFAQEALPLVLVDTHDFVQKPEVIAALASYCTKRQNVFGEAGTTVADPGIQESPPDAGIGSHAIDHLIHVRTHGLAY